MSAKNNLQFTLTRLQTYLFLRCWTLPRHLNLPFTMMAILVHRASHSSILRHTEHSVSAKCEVRTQCEDGVR